MLIPSIPNNEIANWNGNNYFQNCKLNIYELSDLMSMSRNIQNNNIYKLAHFCDGNKLYDRFDNTQILICNLC